MSHEKDNVVGIGGEGRGGGERRGAGGDDSGDILSPSAGETLLSMRPLTSAGQEALLTSLLSATMISSTYLVVAWMWRLCCSGGRRREGREGRDAGRERMEGCVKKEEDRKGGQT